MSEEKTGNRPLEAFSPEWLKVETGTFWDLPGCHSPTLERDIHFLCSDSSCCFFPNALDSEFYCREPFNTEFWIQRLEPSGEAELSQK